MHRTTEKAASGRDKIQTTRLKWFTGRFLTARDLTDEQEYHLDRHRLHNRLLHGWGTVCGLGVHPHERAECGYEWVQVEAGIAIDCHGREIVLPHRVDVRWPVNPELTSAEDALAVLAICYDECLAEPLPAIVSGCDPGTTKEFGRVVERWLLEVHPVGGDPNDPWTKLVDGEQSDNCHDDCEDPDPCRDGCLEPVCDLGNCVPIALLSRCRGGSIEVDAPRDGLRPSVRRSLPPPPTYLTHIVRTSWEHGSELSLDALEESDGQLRIWFDRNLAGGEQDRVGVNPYTFLVEIEDSTGARERLPFDPDNAPRVENGCEAVFTIDPDMLRESRRRGGTRKLFGDTVFVTVLGDLIHDCHGLPVDADFFGAFPTGDGVKGGVLRSWFFVTDGKKDWA